MASEEAPKPSKWYDASCHCGEIKFSFKLSPPLEEGHQVLNYPNKTDVKWHPGAREKCKNYRFNTKTKDQMFCGGCGSSLGIDFLEEDFYGFSARAIDGIDLDNLTYKKLDGLNRVGPAQDLSGKGPDASAQMNWTL
ncbi:hypothetical protein C8035_v001207 [Colletotrichum spinosum]|uniref:CENP-V/GFA domain-containing protein n=1 Tax=Colletotrichum spinosum TaxID=1347390 RepID=A0A4R8QGH9_9PEZI|nr:hypothetical protein C8035_v001207 [Colletotrichum spinosum]